MNNYQKNRAPTPRITHPQPPKRQLLQVKITHQILKLLIFLQRIVVLLLPRLLKVMSALTLMERLSREQLVPQPTLMLLAIKQLISVQLLPMRKKNGMLVLIKMQVTGKQRLMEKKQKLIKDKKLLMKKVEKMQQMNLNLSKMMLVKNDLVNNYFIKNSNRYIIFFYFIFISIKCQIRRDILPNFLLRNHRIKTNLQAEISR